MAEARNGELNQHFQRILKKRNPKDAAQDLFLYAAGQYLTFNFDIAQDKAEFAAINKTMDTYQTMVKESLKNRVMTSEDKNKNLYFSLELMDHLIQLGDMQSAYAVKAALNDLEWTAKKDEALRTAFDTLNRDPQAKSKLHQIETNRSMFALDTYTNLPKVTVPYFGLYANVVDKLKEAKQIASGKGKAQPQDKVMEKTVQLLNQTQKNARDTIKQMHDEVQKNVEAYVKQYSASKNVIDKKKNEMGQLLLAIVKDKASAPYKVAMLKNYIEQAPKILQHKNMLNTLTGSELTLVKRANELLAIYQRADLSASEVSNKTQHQKTPPPVPSREGRPDLSKSNNQINFNAELQQLRADYAQEKANRPRPVKAEPQASKGWQSGMFAPKHQRRNITGQHRLSVSEKVKEQHVQQQSSKKAEQANFNEEIQKMRAERDASRQQNNSPPAPRGKKVAELIKQFEAKESNQEKTPSSSPRRRP